MGTAYRRRTAGVGSRRAGHRKKEGLTASERRRLIQLGASIALFLAVFAGRGLMPEQTAQWRTRLSADMDLGGAVETFGESISQGENVLDAVRTFLCDITGLEADRAVEQESAGTAASQSPVPSELPSARELLESPFFGDLPSLNGSGPDETAGAEEEPDGRATPAASALAEETEAPAGEKLVAAVAQAYSDGGEALPANVSFLYYPLGLSETAMPVSGRVTSPFGYRNHPISGKYSFHTGQDIGVNRGTEIHSFAAGTVRYIGENSVYGLYVRIDHDNGVSTFYAHCQKLLVSKGDSVKCGETIALSGNTGMSTGPHLHFSIDMNGIRLDPAWYLNAAI